MGKTYGPQFLRTALLVSSYRWRASSSAYRLTTTGGVHIHPTRQIPSELSTIWSVRLYPSPPKGWFRRPSLGFRVLSSIAKDGEGLRSLWHQRTSMALKLKIHPCVTPRCGQRQLDDSLHLRSPSGRLDISKPAVALNGRPRVRLTCASASSYPTQCLAAGPRAIRMKTDSLI